MPRYRVRLNDPNSDHFRVTYISADSADEAAEKVRAIDARMVADDNHPQTEPYELEYAVERGQVPEVTR